MCKAGSDAQHAKLWQDDAEPAAKGGEVEAVDGPIAVEVQVRGVGLISGHRAEGRPARGEVESVDRLVAIHVAVQAEQVEGEITAGGAVRIPVERLAGPGDLGRDDRQPIQTVYERTELRQAAGEREPRHR